MRRPVRAAPRADPDADRPGRVFVDSGAWIALLSARDAFHAEADATFRRAVEKRIRLLTTSLIVAEVHRLVLFRAGIGAARSALEHIDESKLVTVEFPERPDHVAALGWLARLDDQAITYTDAVSFAVMGRLGCKLVMSFDSDFTVAGFTRWRPPTGIP